MNEHKKWLSEYETFLQSDNVAVPKEISTPVLSKMSKFLNPSAWLVFGKVLGIHLLVGFLSLAVCHQFGMNPFGTNQSLDTWFMAMLGHNGCMIACGVLFTSAGVLTAGYFLKIEELRALKQTQFLQTLALGTVSLALFIIFGAEIALAIAGFWFLGAVAGGILATEFAWKLRRFA